MNNVRSFASFRILHTASRLVAAVVVALPAGFAAGAEAQDLAASLTTSTEGAGEAPRSSAKADPAELGVAQDGLSGFIRTPSALRARRKIALAGNFAYGYTEDQGPLDNGSHHRVSGSVAIGVQPLDWLGFSAALEGRADFHGEDELGPDDGKSGQPRFGARATYAFNDDLGVGLDMRMGIPGSSAPSFDFGTLALDTTVIATYRFLDAFYVGTRMGFRYDRSAQSIDNPGALRQGDRIAIGMSEYNAVLFALALAYQRGPLELLIDYSLDLLVGAGAPPFAQSPSRINMGARYAVLSALQVEGGVEVVPSSRPPSAPTDPLVPIEPRLSILLGIRYVLPIWQKVVEDSSTGGASAAKEAVADTQSVALALAVVASDGDRPVSAAVTLETANDSGESEQVAYNLETGSDGTLTLSELSPGSYKLSVAASGFETSSQIITLDSQPSLRELRIALEAKTPPGQMRGVIRSFRGAALNAEVKVFPGDHALSTDEHGEFSIDLDPGEYTVEINASGYRPQTRSVVLEENGVTILNIDLRKK